MIFLNLFIPIFFPGVGGGRAMVEVAWFTLTPVLLYVLSTQIGNYTIYNKIVSNNNPTS